MIRVLGKGAMGLVYEGRDPNLDRRVAIKTITVENLSEEAAADYEVRFRTEARSAARLQHPNIVSVYDSDRHGDIAFLVMEFIQGDDLKHHLDQGELYTLRQSLAIMTDLLSALDYAHKQSIVHRDIKPANLLIEASGRVKLTDFGVARIQDSGDATRTQGTMVGTLKYMSPEQVQGRPVDARSDIFAAAVLLYQLLTGKRPFDGDTDFATIQQIVLLTPAGPTSFNTNLPHAIDAVMARALAKSRDLRYASALEFSAALQSACREAVDPMTLPQAAPLGPGSSSTWTSTLMAGEALVGTRPGQNIQTGLATNTGIPASAVTQEVELVYWKDIKDSMDVEDIRGFLAKFPDGIYADLARRRLRKLGAAAGDATDTGLRSGTGSLLLPRGAPAGSKLQDTLNDVGSARQVLDAANGAARRHASMRQPAPTQRDALPLVPVFAGDEATMVLARPMASDAPTSSKNTPQKAAQKIPGEALVSKSPEGSAMESLKDLANASKNAVVGVTPNLQIPLNPLIPVNPTSPMILVSPPGNIHAVQPGSVASPVGVPAAASPQKAPGAADLLKDPASPAASSRRNGVIAAAIVAMALAGAGALWLSGRSTVDPALTALPDPAVAAAPAFADAASSAVTKSVAPAAAASAATVEAAVSAVAAASTGTSSVPTAKISTASAAPVNAASTAAASAKKIALEKERLPKPAQTRPEPAQASAPASDKPAAPPPAVSPVRGAAEFCEGRLLFAYQTCMSEQCAKPAFKALPVCVERRAMDQRRREAEQSR